MFAAASSFIEAGWKAGEAGWKEMFPYGLFVTKASEVRDVTDVSDVSDVGCLKIITFRSINGGFCPWFCGHSFLESFLTALAHRTLLCLT